MLISEFSNIEKVYIAVDEIVDSKDQTKYKDYLHTLNPSTLYSYKST